jgi:hypothetical protein
VTTGSEKRMPSKESLERAEKLCSCTGFPEGEHGPHCYTTKAAILLDAVRLEDAKDWFAVVKAACNPRYRRRCLNEGEQRVRDLEAIQPPQAMSAGSEKRV